MAENVNENKQRLSISKKIDENTKKTSILDAKYLLQVHRDQESEESHFKKAILEPEEDDQNNYLWKLWSFDKVHLFSKYCPDNNCHKILKDFNKVPHASHFYSIKRKRKILKRYSDYFLYPSEIFERLKSGKKQKKTINSCKTNETKKVFGDSLFNLVMMLKNRKKQKSKFDMMKSLLRKMMKKIVE